MIRRLLPAALAAAFVVLAAPAAAQQAQSPKPAEQHGAGHGADHAMSGWKEMDAFHLLMMETWHPAKGQNDLKPLRARAGAMADAAQAWAAAAVPKACDTPETRATLAALAKESRALAAQAARADATDAQLKASLKALHDRFEPVEHGCTPGGHGKGHGKGHGMEHGAGHKMEHGKPKP